MYIWPYVCVVYVGVQMFCIALCKVTLSNRKALYKQNYLKSIMFLCNLYLKKNDDPSKRKKSERIKIYYATDHRYHKKKNGCFSEPKVLQNTFVLRMSQKCGIC